MSIMYQLCVSRIQEWETEPGSSLSTFLRVKILRVPKIDSIFTNLVTMGSDQHTKVSDS